VVDPSGSGDVIVEIPMLAFGVQPLAQDIEPEQLLA
jgi:hypothetical protein